MESDDILKSEPAEGSLDPDVKQEGSDSPQNGKLESSKLDNIKEAPIVQLKTTQDKKQIAGIMKLLKSYGLDGSLTELERETGLSKDEIKDLTIETDVIQVLNQYKSNADKDSYKEAYQALQRFVDQSLDSTRAELSQLLYPCFAHFYLKLIINGHDNARAFYDEFSVGFGTDSPYIEDIRRLATISNRKQLEQNDIITTFKVRQFIIRLTRDSFISLKRTINEKKLQVLTDVVEDHLFIDQFDGLPRTQQQIDAVAGGLLGEAKRDANKSKVFLGLMREPEVPDHECENELEDEPRKKKKAKAPTFRKTRNDPNAPSVTRIPLIGLVENQLTSADQADWLAYYKDQEHRAKLTGEQKLSAVYYSILNSENDLLPSAITISDDSTLIAAGFEDGLIRIFSIGPERLKELKSSEELEMMDKDRMDLENVLKVTEKDSRTLVGHSGSVFGVAISPRRDFLVSGGEDGTVRLWSLLVYQGIIVHRGHLWPVWDVHFGPFGHYFCSAGMDRSLRVWTTEKESPVRLMAGHYGDVECARFHPNSNYIATGSVDRCVRLWDLLEGKCVRTLTGHRSAISSIAWSTSAGRYLATGDIGGQVLFWDISKSTKSDEILIARFSIDEQKGNSNVKISPQHLQVTALTFSRCGNLLTAGTVKGEICSWDIARTIQDNDNDEVNISANGIAKNYRYHPPYRTKRSSIGTLQYSRRNVLIAAGPFGR